MSDAADVYFHNPALNHNCYKFYNLILILHFYNTNSYHEALLLRLLKASLFHLVVFNQVRSGTATYDVTYSATYKTVSKILYLLHSTVLTFLLFLVISWRSLFWSMFLLYCPFSVLFYTFSNYQVTNFCFKLVISQCIASNDFLTSLSKVWYFSFRQLLFRQFIFYDKKVRIKIIYTHTLPVFFYIMQLFTSVRISITSFTNSKS